MLRAGAGQHLGGLQQAGSKGQAGSWGVGAPGDLVSQRLRHPTTLPRIPALLTHFPVLGRLLHPNSQTDPLGILRHPPREINAPASEKIEAGK